MLPIEPPLVQYDNLNLAHARLQNIPLQSIPDVLLHFFKRMIVLQRQDARAEPYNHFPLRNVDGGSDGRTQRFGFSQPMDIEYFLRLPRQEEIQRRVGLSKRRWIARGRA